MAIPLHVRPFVTTRLCIIFFTVAVLFPAAIQAATFVVPDDRSLVRQSEAILIAASVYTYSQQSDDGGIETITNMTVEEVIKGTVGSDAIDVREPGGVLDDRALIIPGVPRFVDGERYLLFLTRADGVWRVRDLALGKFSFRTDRVGRKVLVRDEGEIMGWDPDGKPHRESHRSAPEFLEFVRIEAKGGMGRQDYFVPKEPLLLEAAAKQALLPTANAAFTATSYTFTVSGSLGGRWNVFPSGVNFFSVGTEPGAPGGGTTAINVSFNSWNGDPSSNVNYVYAGADNSGTHTGGVSRPDSQNTIAFEVDLSSLGIPPFQCTSTSYSGTLGVGGITSAGASHSGPNGEAFATTFEGDVTMNRGIANCSLLFNSGDFNSAVAHEVGHTLGFRHSDQTRADNPSVPCSTDPSLECSTTAIMKSFVSQGLNGALQPWDQHAVAAVYPGTGGGTVLATPSGVNARPSSATQVQITWSAVSGATSYQIFRRTPGSTAFVQVGTSSSTSFVDTTVSPNTAYLYRVRAVGSSGTSADSFADLATTVIFTDDPLTPRATVIKAVHLAQLRTAVNAVRSLAAMSPTSFTDAASPGVKVKAIHITQLRTSLDQALSALSLSSGGYTDSIVPGVVVKAVHFQEVRNKVK